MAFSEDEEEDVLHSVTNYYFVDGDDEPVSFVDLPLRFNDQQISNSSSKMQVFLLGTADNGLQKVYKQVIAWKLELVGKLEVSVLSKDNTWIKLKKPRKSFEDTIRTIMVTIHCLYFLRKNDGVSGRTLWEHLRKIFSTYETVPSQQDLLVHEHLIRAMVKKDRALARSKFLLTFLEKPGKRKAGYQDTSTVNVAKRFIVSGDAMEENTDGNSAEKANFFDVCAICDNGGELLSCEGRCLRSFHATPEDGAESQCKSLGLTATLIKEMNRFYCPNCEYGVHQCFACGKLGSSRKSADPKVFLCASAMCGYFYHPACVVKLLYRGSEDEIEVHRKKIAAGESFTCPMHMCIVCGKGEVRGVKNLQLAVCRRCPKAYHRKCLPGNIAFESSQDGDVQRAWDGLLSRRVLIYCRKHTIVKELLTPPRDHIVFPDAPKSIGAAVSSKTRVIGKESMGGCSRIVEVPARQEHSFLEVSHKSTKLLDLNSTKTHGDDSFKAVTSKTGSLATKNIMHAEIDDHCDNLAAVGSKLEDASSSRCNSPFPGSTVVEKLESLLPIADKEAKAIVVAAAEKSCASLLNEAQNKQKAQSTCSYHSRDVDENVTESKIEMTEGGSTEDTKTMSDFKSNKRIIGQQMVQKLHWYVQNGDTVVDICCVEYNLNTLLEQLNGNGKVCFFKRYDNFWPKSDFNVQTSNLLKVMQDNLPTGSRLIMIMSLPIGVNVVAGYKFINMVLDLKPKIVVIIAPYGTKLNDLGAYDLIWEDHLKCLSKIQPSDIVSDTNDEQMSVLSAKPCLLHLWSRCDWSSKHKAIALTHGHLPSSFGKVVGHMEKEELGNKSCDDFSRKYDLSKLGHDQEGPPFGKTEDKLELNGTMKGDEKRSCASQEVKDDMEEKWLRGSSVMAEGLGVGFLNFVPGPLHPISPFASSSGWISD